MPLDVSKSLLFFNDPFLFTNPFLISNPLLFSVYWILFEIVFLSWYFHLNLRIIKEFIIIFIYPITCINILIIKSNWLKYVDLPLTRLIILKRCLFSIIQMVNCIIYSVSIIRSNIRDNLRIWLIKCCYFIFTWFNFV